VVNFTPLPREFYQPRAQTVAPLLLGHLLLRRTANGLCGGIIVETEAYLHDDPACHAFRGKTPRNGAMFGPPGRAYVYFIYGSHYCVNAVCNVTDVGEAVLIRAVEPIVGLEILRTNRAVAKGHELTNGPAKLCQAMAINRALDGENLCDATAPLFIACNPQREEFLSDNAPLLNTPRIGITQAKELPLRFLLARNGFVSKPARSITTSYAK
jgi:DNA-3-methyladenine glycosylase